MIYPIDAIYELHLQDLTIIQAQRRTQRKGIENESQPSINPPSELRLFPTGIVFHNDLSTRPMESSIR